MRIHLIAIGGSIMHNLAIALHKKGFEVTGSDDSIYEPAKSRLAQHGLLPQDMGWRPEMVTKEIDVVLLGMHAKEDNPELKKAQELGLPIVSFPEFIYEQSKNKKRIVVAGSHGKTTVTAMLMHVLKKLNYDFDYAVGSSIQGFEDSVRLSEDAPLIVIEGDEYLSSAIDRRPKMLWYKPHIALINGIAWDHINVFPTYEIYKKQFADFIEQMEPGRTLVYFEEDAELKELIEQHGHHLECIAARLPEFSVQENKTVINREGEKYPLSVFGRHNIQNLVSAMEICRKLGIKPEDFWKAAGDFTGAGKRLEKVPNGKGLIVFRDFAHAPSKVKATVEAIDEQYPDKETLAVLELHTFSSLNKEFIVQYQHTLDRADKAIVYVDREAMKKKGTESYQAEEIRKAFGRPDIQFIEEPEPLKEAIAKNLPEKGVLLMMSSGNFGGMKVEELIN